MEQSAKGRAWIEVDLAKIRSNFEAVKKRAGLPVMAVVKADSYGLGVQTIAPLLRDSGAAAFGVATMNEALEVLPLGIPVQVLGNLLPEEVEQAVSSDIWCPAGSLESARLVSAEAVRQGKTVNIALSVDTGMGRLGMIAEDAFEEIMEINALPNIRLHGLYSHFSSASSPLDPYNQFQIERFKKLIARLAGAGVNFTNIHIAASDGLNNIEESRKAPFTLTRTGIDLYGYCDSATRTDMGLQTAVEFKSRIAAVRTLKAGDYVGYSRMHRLNKSQRVATISAGYADGIPLALTNRGYVIIRGVLCPVVGRISMDYTTVNVDNVPEAALGDEVVFVGHQGAENIPLEDWASLKNTHAYELLCSVGRRVGRIYVNG